MADGDSQDLVKQCEAVLASVRALPRGRFLWEDVERLLAGMSELLHEVKRLRVENAGLLAAFEKPTLRDWYAMAVLAGFIANSPEDVKPPGDLAANYVFWLADLMVSKRSEGAE